MGPTMSSIALGCSDPEEDQDLSHIPGEQAGILRAANKSEVPLSGDSTASELPYNYNSLSALSFNVYHSNIESIAAASTSISSKSKSSSAVLETTVIPDSVDSVTSSKESDHSQQQEVKASRELSSDSGTHNNCDSDIKATGTNTSSESESCKVAPSPSAVPSTDNMETVAVTADFNLENGELSGESGSNPMEEVDETPSPPPVAPSNTPITGDSGHNSPTQEHNNVGSSDESQKEKKAEKPEDKPSDKLSTAAAVSNPVKESSKNGSKESKKDKKDSGKNKKKEDKGIEYILRALNSLQTPEEKLAALCKRYADMHEEHRVLQTSFKTQQRSMTMLMREKDQVQSDHAKAVIAKSKLESLCRELQKQNKLIKDESIQRAKEDDEKRREISAKFQTTIGEIQTQMNNNNDRNTKLQKENMELASQLKKFVEQYENREKKMKQHRDLEQQLAEAKLVQARALLKEEQDKNAKERELLLMKAAESAKKVSLLEAQVTMFKDRYDEFESLHTRSNETFQKYKTEMDKMTKRIKRLEKDGLAWKSKWERTNKSLIEALEARSNSEKETTVYVQKTKKLESLCRALQAELHKDKAPKPSEKSTSNDTSPVNDVPPNSPEASPVSDQTSSPDSTSQSNDAAAEAVPSSSTTSCDTTTTTTTVPEVPTRGEGDGQPTSTSSENGTSNQTPSNETTESSNLPSNESKTHQEQSSAQECCTKDETQSPSSLQTPLSSNPMDEVET